MEKQEEAMFRFQFLCDADFNSNNSFFTDYTDNNYFFTRKSSEHI